MKEIRFFLCRHCGNLILMVEDSGVVPHCCGEKMTLLKANSTEASGEKHLPVVQLKDGCITADVGSAAHPMEDGHHIAWIALSGEKGIQIRRLCPTGAPRAEFLLADGDRPLCVYAYCNLHGLWRVDL